MVLLRRSFDSSRWILIIAGLELFTIIPKVQGKSGGACDAADCVEGVLWFAKHHPWLTAIGAVGILAISIGVVVCIRSKEGPLKKKTLPVSEPIIVGEAIIANYGGDHKKVDIMNSNGSDSEIMICSNHSNGEWNKENIIASSKDTSQPFFVPLEEGNGASPHFQLFQKTNIPLQQVLVDFHHHPAHSNNQPPSYKENVIYNGDGHKKIIA